jgi:hypothetical protein
MNYFYIYNVYTVMRANQCKPMQTNSVNESLIDYSAVTNILLIYSKV